MSLYLKEISNTSTFSRATNLFKLHPDRSHTIISFLKTSHVFRSTGYGGHCLEFSLRLATGFVELPLIHVPAISFTHSKVSRTDGRRTAN